jgi:hypothetical protein
MDEIESTLTSVRDLKKRAKNRRDFDRMEEAIQLVTKAIDQLRRPLSEPLRTPNEEADLNAELADCYGILGGIYRRWAFADLQDRESRQEKLRLSYQAYDNGFLCEQKSGKPNSYNRLNRLIGRIFYNPTWLSKTGDLNEERKFLIDELKKSEHLIENQLLSQRNKDVWALADIALIKTLLTEEDPVKLFSPFVSESPDLAAFSSVLSVLKPMSQLEIDMKPRLMSAILFLERVSGNNSL